MTSRSDIPPRTLPVSLEQNGIEIEYLDGRTVFYHGVPQKATGTVRCNPGKEVHILVTNDPGTNGVLTYINDRKTHDDILESTGVGRILLSRDEQTEVFPGIDILLDGLAVEITPTHDVIDGRVFVFEEDEFSEQSYELVEQ